MNKKNINTLITKNKKAYFDFEIINTYEAWIELRWYETKSIRNKYVNLKGSYIITQNNELYVKSMHVSPWKTLANKTSVDPIRLRKIFLYRKDIDYLVWKSKEPWYSMIPLELYFSWSLIKLRVWLARWKKDYQKKQLLKERAMDKEAKIAMKKFI